MMGHTRWAVATPAPKRTNQTSITDDNTEVLLGLDLAALSPHRGIKGRSSSTIMIDEDLKCSTIMYWWT